MLTTDNQKSRSISRKIKLMLRIRYFVRYTFAFVAALLLLASVVQSTTVAAKRRKKIVLSEFVIEGRVQKPQAFLLLQRQRVEFKGLQMKKSFIPKILKSMDKKPF